MKILIIGKANYPIQLLPYPQLLLPYLLIPLQELTFSWKPVASLNFHPKFSILIYYLCPSSPICLEIIPSYSPIKIGSITLPLQFGIRPQQPNNPKNPYTKTKNDMLIKCLPIVHQS